MNADGFGVGWYSEDATPGRYRDTYPAWNDTNLAEIAEHVRSPLFMAHVRASSGTPVQRTNCHPFRFETWLFQHNGSIPAFERVRRELLLSLDPALFPHIEGTTDTELLFFLALTHGLQADPGPALERTVARVESAVRSASVDEALTFTVAVSDGTRLFAVRYASDGDAPSLYRSRHAHALRVVDGSYEPLPDGAVLLVSEPLDELSEHWTEVAPRSFVTVHDGRVEVSGFEPRP